MFQSIEVLLETLCSHKTIISCLRTSNQKDSRSSRKQLMVVDMKWFLMSPVPQKLRSRQNISM